MPALENTKHNTHEIKIAEKARSLGPAWLGRRSYIIRTMALWRRWIYGQIDDGHSMVDIVYKYIDAVGRHVIMSDDMLAGRGGFDADFWLTRVMNVAENFN